MKPLLMHLKRKVSSKDQKVTVVSPKTNQLHALLVVSDLALLAIKCIKASNQQIKYQNAKA
jgi:hypothetical protein